MAIDVLTAVAEGLPLLSLPSPPLPSPQERLLWAANIAPAAIMTAILFRIALR